MKTSYFQLDQLQVAGQLLAQGRLVAFPTETVYGLGANALDEVAVNSIFAAKGRPSDNPLIVHISSLRQLEDLAVVVSNASQLLIDQFWPGPLTLVFPKKKAVPDCVTAGLETVAVRFPSHAWAVELIRHSGVPIAAPSANLSGRPSATTWQSVKEDLDGRIDGIVCGPPTKIGLESTVVDASSSPPRILRPGKISYEDLIKVCPDIVSYQGETSTLHEDRGMTNLARSESTAFESSIESTSHTIPNSPGLRHKHYQPRARVVIVSGPTQESNDTSAANREHVTYIGRIEQHDAPKYALAQNIDSVEDYASKLFDFFRRSDELQAARIECQAVANAGIGAALMDRLTRASATDKKSMEPDSESVK